MRADWFDVLALVLDSAGTRGSTRRQALGALTVGVAAILGLATETSAKEETPQETVQATLHSGGLPIQQQFCPGKTGRVRGPAAKPVARCNNGDICCLPLFAGGCLSDCDCCGAATVCASAGFRGVPSPI